MPERVVVLTRIVVLLSIKKVPRVHAVTTIVIATHKYIKGVATQLVEILTPIVMQKYTRDNLYRLK